MFFSRVDVAIGRADSLMRMASPPFPACPTASGIGERLADLVRAPTISGGALPNRYENPSFHPAIPVVSLPEVATVPLGVNSKLNGDPVPIFSWK